MRLTITLLGLTLDLSFGRAWSYDDDVDDEIELDYEEDCFTSQLLSAY